MALTAATTTGAAVEAPTTAHVAEAIAVAEGITEAEEGGRLLLHELPDLAAVNFHEVQACGEGGDVYLYL